GGEPVEEHAVGDLASEPAHLRPERGDDELRSKVLPQRGHAVANAVERSRIRAAHPEPEPVERQRVSAYALDDGLWAARVQLDHADTERDAPRFLGGRRERAQPVERTRMIDPERRVARAFRLAGGGGDDLALHVRGDGESPAHGPLLAIVHTMPHAHA